MLTFRLECFANEYLPEGGRHLDAVVTVTAGGSLPAPAPDEDGLPPVSEVIVLDASGSMDGAKFREARIAAAIAVRMLRPGTRFAVLAGTDGVRAVYPVGPRLATASPATVAAAAKQLRRQRSGGGTCIGTWVTAAAELLRPEPGIRHAILLTDGRNERETPRQLSAAVEAARGVFQCDCRGVGTDWSVAELRTVADALLGTVDIVARPENLGADFAAITARVMGRQLADVTLRVWTPRGVHVELFKQVAPEVVDLPESGADGEPASRDYPTGAWSAENRSYQLRLRLPSGEVGDEILAARVSLLDGPELIGKVLVRGTWTDDIALSTHVNATVGHYTGQIRMSEAIRQGLGARRAGDAEAAERLFGEAVALASSSGNTDMLVALRGVVDIADAATGRVRLRADPTREDEMTLDARSTRTTAVRRAPAAPG